MAAIAATSTTNPIKYRFLGDLGLLISTIGLSLMMQDDSDNTNVYNILLLRRSAATGIDNGVWMRDDLVGTTKILFGPNQRTERQWTQSLPHYRSYQDLASALMKECHELCYCPDWAFYWGTSERRDHNILEARAVAQKLGLITPIVEQPQYNPLTRFKFEVEYPSLLQASALGRKLGMTTWSPLASGVLTDKHASGKPDGPRLASAKYAHHVRNDFNSNIAAVEKLRPLAHELGCSSRSSCENLDALPTVAKITPKIKQRIDTIMPLHYKATELDQYCYIRVQYL